MSDRPYGTQGMESVPRGNSAQDTGTVRTVNAFRLTARRPGILSFVPCVAAELTKLRRSPVWLAFIVMPAVSCALGTANYLMNLDALTPGWTNLWTQQTLFMCYFFLPALIGVAASYLWRLEHQGSNWNELMVSPVPAWCVFCAKLVVAGICMALAFASIVALFAATGAALGITEAFPAGTILTYALLGWAGSMAIAAIQLVISMLVRNFAAPVGIALGGGVMGLAATLAGLGYRFPYSLMQSGMNANNLVKLTAHNALQLTAASAVYVLLAVISATAYLRHSDIHAD